VKTYDLHAHIISAEAIAEMGAAFPDAGPVLEDREDGVYLRYPGRPAMGPVPQAMVDVEPRLADMDRQGVDVQVLAVPPSQFHYHVEAAAGVAFASLQNDALIELSRRIPTRFEAFATLPLQDPDASVAEIRRIGGDPEVRGVQIWTHVNGANLDAEALEPVWQALVDAELPVWIHPDQRGVAGEERLGSYYLVNLIGNPLESTIAIASLIFGGVMRRHPGLRFGFVHGGGFTPYQIGRWDHGHGKRAEARLQIEESPSVYFDRMFFDTLTHNSTSLRFLVEQVGDSQVVLGSDYPFDMASTDPLGALRAAGLSDDQERVIRQDNAERFLRARDDG
jgi:aminocarboxymuconate-semialdehyde decarboxylase